MFQGLKLTFNRFTQAEESEREDYLMRLRYLGVKVFPWADVSMAVAFSSASSFTDGGIQLAFGGMACKKILDVCLKLREDASYISWAIIDRFPQANDEKRRPVTPSIACDLQ